MSTFVIGSTLADAEDFCRRNPDFYAASRLSPQTAAYDGRQVTDFVLTPSALAAYRSGDHLMNIALQVMTRSAEKSALFRRGEVR